MSLSAFLRDYLYFPLGGGRQGETRRYVNLMTTMLLGGFWHGASWNFIVWGGMHGAYLGLNHFWRYLENRMPLRASLFLIPPAAAWAITFFSVVFAWVPFRAETISDTSRMWHAMLGLDGVALPRVALDVAGMHFALHGFGALTLADVQHFLPLKMAIAQIACLMAIVLLLPNSRELVEGHPSSGYLMRVFPKLMQQNLHPVRAIVWGVAFGYCLTILGHATEFLYYRF
jgi:D-alanyl-lipoteichoic acid acyltransferase DltB (MBOAT superfamily)